MNDITIGELTELVKTFCEERDWDQFHKAKDLAIGISTEANELLDIFRFKSDEDVMDEFADPVTREHIGEELADTLFFVLRFAQMNGLDLGQCLQDKLQKNAAKYPVEKSRGSNLKSTELR